MKFQISLFFCLVVVLAGMVHAIELTPENWDDETTGKTVFIKFFAPWCGHCKAMKPTWDKLMESFTDSSTALVADVDCTGEGEALCMELGVDGFPTLKYGDPNALEEYEGGRDYETLKAFAEKNLVPLCSPMNLDICDDAKKEEIKKYQDMLENGDLQTEIDTKMTELQNLEIEFESAVQKLQDTYDELVKEKQTKSDEINKNSGLSLMKMVLAASKQQQKKAEDGKDEL